MAEAWSLTNLAEDYTKMQNKTLSRQIQIKISVYLFSLLFPSKVSQQTLRS